MESVLPAEVPISGRLSAESAKTGAAWPAVRAAIRVATSVRFNCLNITSFLCWR